MGLLDDAIREHLELKRRSGADPGAIAQAEHDALDPIFAEEDGASAEAPPTPDGAVEDDRPEAADAPEAAEDIDFAAVGQETAELDMQAVLDEDARPAPAPLPSTPDTAQPVRAAPASPSAAEEEIAWHEDDGSEAAPEVIPGQERLSFE